jgi:hypothetical protein
MELGHVPDGDASGPLHVRCAAAQFALWCNGCLRSYDTPQSRDKYISMTLSYMIQVLKVVLLPQRLKSPICGYVTPVGFVSCALCRALS